jgi:hypothetical protein
MKTDIEMFKRGIGLLQQNPKSQACLKFAMLAGWNFALIESPIMAYVAWNTYLQTELKVNEDAFVDRGETPEQMTRAEMEEIRVIEKVPSDPLAKGFDPFYFWKFPRPKQSPKYIKKQREIESARQEYLSKYTTQNKPMRNQYMESEIS